MEYLFIDYCTDGIREVVDIDGGYNIFTANMELIPERVPICLREISKWCIECGMLLIYDDMVAGQHGRIFRVHFDCEEDLMAFKLTWL